VRVELFAEGAEGDQPFRQEMTLMGKPAGPGAARLYGAHVPAARPAADYTARLVPHHDGVVVPLEAGLIHWQR
jgi:starch phosphorylase